MRACFLAKIALSVIKTAGFFEGIVFMLSINPKKKREQSILLQNDFTKKYE
jgi:hypothetical protein